MKFGIYKILGLFAFVFFVSIFKFDLVFSANNKYCINSGGYCVEQHFPEPRYLPGECSDGYTANIPSEQACNTFLSDNYSFCLSTKYSCKLELSAVCTNVPEENGQKFSPNPMGLTQCTAARAMASIASVQRYCKCSSDKGICEEGAKLKSDCDKAVQDSNGQFAQCILTTVDKTCSSVSTARKFCACAPNKSACGPTIYANLQECNGNKGAVDASFQCVQVDNDKACSSLSQATQNGNNTPGNASSSLLSGLDSQIKGLNKLGVVNVQELLGRVISTVLGVLGSVALVMIMYGGLTFMTAAGNAEKRKKAGSLLVWSVLGITVIFASYAIVSFVLGIF